MRYIVTSDIHFGHKKTPTAHIVTSFVKSILSQANKTADALFIAGDLFDHLLYLNTKEAQMVVQFIHRLLDYCWENAIALKVLEGTPSHDWYQSSMVDKINATRKDPVQLTYVRSLEIEFCQKLQKHILYIPDEWCNNQEDLEIQIKSKMVEMGIDKVDISILHGAFRYQAKGIPVSSFLYDEAYFLHLTRGFVHIGHYHTHTRFDRIVANGSLERLAHGEEEPKGYVLVEGEVCTFIENPRAYTYKTVHVNAATTLERLDKTLHKLPPQSHVRLSMKVEHPFNTLFTDLEVRYPQLNLKKLVKDASVNSSVTYILSEESFTVPEHSILETNVYDAVMRSISLKHTLSSRELVKLGKYSEVLRSVDTPVED